MRSSLRARGGRGAATVLAMTPPDAVPSPERSNAPSVPPAPHRQRIVPTLWFAHTATEAVDAYVAAFAAAGGHLSTAHTGIVETSYYPTHGLADFQEELAGDVLEIRFRLAGLEFSALNAGDEFRPNPAISFMVFFDPQADRAIERLDELFARLSAGGQVLMELGQYPFARRFGWVADRWGVTWQLTTAEPGEAATRSEVGAAARVAPGSSAADRGGAGARGPETASGAALRIVPALMFPHGEGQATEAAELYTQVFGRAFGDSRVGELAFYPQGSGQGDNALLQGWMRLAGQPLTLMDSGAPHAFTFDLGVSLAIQCADQEQIDEVWQGLSAVPEAEVCGWLKDRFGVSWQVAPENMSDLMRRPGAWEVMMAMRKPVLADFERLPRE